MPRRSLQTLLALLVGLAPAGAAIPSPPPFTEDGTWVSFAGGAIQFLSPSQLVASELPRGRQVLLVLSRQAPPQQPRLLRDGLWLAVSPGNSRGTSPNSQVSMLSKGLERDYHEVTLGKTKLIDCQGLPATRVHFTIPSHRPLFAAPGKQAVPQLPASKGWRQTVCTDWGTVEIHFVSPLEDADAREKEIESLLASLKLRTPQDVHQDVAPHLLDAESIIGSWKSPKALLELHGQGQVELRYDRANNYELGREGLVDYQKPVRKLSGQFTASGDLLHIRWSDSSLLNIRWRLAEDELLITDHQGRTRRLTRLYR